MEFIWPIITALISGFISYCLSCHSAKLDLAKYREGNIFDTKRKTIISSLNFLDDYLSFLSYDSGIIPVRKEVKTTESLTIEARKIYNELSNTCENEKVPELFLSIIFDEFDKPKYRLDTYNQYRNACREEIGLKEIKLDNNKIFLSIVSTEELEKRKKV